MADLGAWSALMAPGDDPGSLVELFAAGRPSWFADAACRQHPELSWHPKPGESTTAVRAVCAACLVVDECCDYALADPGLVGVWGGMSVRERDRLRRARTRSNAA